MSAVGLTRNGAVATLTLDRPEARNALEPAMMVELRELVTALPLDGTRVIILTGAGAEALCLPAQRRRGREHREREQEDASRADLVADPP